MTFEEFARSELPGLACFATAMCGDRGQAEDILQEVLLRCSQRWERIGGVAHPAAYVRTMIVHEFLGWRRKWARFVPVEDVPVAAVADPTDAADDRDLLLSQLSRLGRRHRAVLALRYYAGLSDAEIAVELGCSQSAVRSYASRALATLRIDMQGDSGAASATLFREA